MGCSSKSSRKKKVPVRIDRDETEPTAGKEDGLNCF